MPVSAEFRPSTAHMALGDAFYDVVEAARFPLSVLRFRNQRWAERVGLGDLTEAEWIGHFARFTPLPGSLPQPLALRYHGHQFRAYNPDLGDGRGFLFAQVHDLHDHRLLDLGTKGSGQTPWSRHADGRLTLKGGVREVLATEMLEALGVNTSKSFSLIETGEPLERGDEPSPTRSSVLVRLSHSHIRIGTFQRFLYLGEHDRIAELRDHVIRTYMPDLWAEDDAARTINLLDGVGQRVARTGAQWMAAGFVHGVLNTDNINITGESFDYGPWRFLPVLDHDFTAAYFDQTGLYAFGRQPEALLWNLTRLAECLLPFAPQADLEAALGRFAPALQAAFTVAMLRRLGLAPRSGEENDALVSAFWRFLTYSRVPFERAFFDWHGGLADPDRAAASPLKDEYRSERFAPVRAALAAFEPAPDTRLDHPYFRQDTPCTLLIEEVERIWDPIDRADDWSAFHDRIARIRSMGEAYGNSPAHPAKVPDA